jgi:hypothetical protein
MTSEDALLTGNSDTSFSQEASQTSNNSRKNANRFRIMVPFLLLSNVLNDLFRSAWRVDTRTKPTKFLIIWYMRLFSRNSLY